MRAPAKFFASQQNENLGYKFRTIRAIYNKSSPEEQKELREFWDCFPEKMWKKRKKTDEEWKEIFTNFIKEVGFSKLTFNIKYKDINIGNKFHHFKNKYRKATPEEQKEMREFWDCFPAGKWDK
jgi:histidyl-tRNA synthetase